MKNTDKLKYFQNLVVDHGMAHLIFQQTGIYDIIHPFSTKGNEFLNEDFVVFVEQYRNIIPQKCPIILEIDGSSLSDEEKERIDLTIWEQFCFKMAKAYEEARSCLFRGIAFFLLLIVSSSLLFLVNERVNEAIELMAYVIYWFLGYRFLSYLILDIVPNLQDKSWYRKLASTKIVFSGTEDYIFETLDFDIISNEFKAYQEETNRRMNEYRLWFEEFKKEKNLTLPYHVESMDDVVQKSGIPRIDFLSNNFAKCLNMVEQFLKLNKKITLEVQGKEFDSEEQKRISLAVHNHYDFYMAEEEKVSVYIFRRIMLFGILSFITALFLILWGQETNIALHELIIIIVWFFMEYLIEFFITLGVDIRKNLKVKENFRNMNIVFD